MIDALGPRGGRPVADRDEEHEGEPAIVIVADVDAVGAAAARHIVERVTAAVAERGRANVALTGGSTPEAIYRHLVAPALRDRVAWSRVHLWWGDDRFVPRADPLSNVRLADQRLHAPGGIPIPTANVHPFPVDRALDEGLGAAWCAATYAAEVVGALPVVDGWPSFDLVLVGIGTDGHLLSVFPGSPALASDRIGLAIPAPSHIEPHVERVTLNPAILDAAGSVLATATGRAKAGVIARIFDGPRDPAVLPGVLARRSGATWILDREAAARLAGPSDGPVGLVVRRATAADAAAIGDVWIAAFEATYAFPAAHTEPEIRAWIGRDLLTESETWVAVKDGLVVGFMSLTDDMLDQLYIGPGATGHGTGSQMVQLAKARRPDGLDLYTFQVNTGARRFYERHGFVAIAFGDGRANEEHQPDVRYRWTPEP